MSPCTTSRTERLPIVRFPSGISHRAAYEMHHEPGYAKRGVVVPASRPPRAIGSRVHLEIALADGTVVYGAGAVVIAHLGEDAEFGELLRLDLVRAGARPVEPHAAAPASAGASPDVFADPPVLERRAAAPPPLEPAPDDATDPTAAIHLAPPRAALAARLARHRAALAAAAIVAATCGAAVLAVRHRAAVTDAAFAAELSAADDRLREGRIATAGGDSALDHLAAARRLLPEDPRLTARGKAIADALEGFGERALARGDLGEAAAHFEGALRAEPTRASARDRVETITRIAPRRPAPPRADPERPR